MTDEQEITLRETTDRLSEIFEELEESGGELTPEIEKDLEKFTEGRKDKAHKIIKFSRQMKYMAEGLKAEASRLSDSARTKLAASDRIERYLLAEMQILGEKKMHTDLYTITRARIGRPRIDLKEGVNLELLDEDLVRIIPEKIELDKTAVWNHLKAKGAIPKEVGQFDVEDFEVTVSERLSIS